MILQDIPTSTHRRLGAFLTTFCLSLAAAAVAPAQTFVDLATETVTEVTSLTPQAGINLTQGTAQGLASGDLNQDGIDDLIVGAAGRAESTVPPLEGKIFAIFGPINTEVDLTNPLDVDMTIEDADAGDLFGWSSLVADFNGDGIEDLAVGALLGDGPTGNRTDAGEVHVFFGPFQAGTLSLSAGDADVTIYGVDANDHLGAATAAHDISGDGQVDLLIGAPSSADSQGQFGAGSAHVIFGPLAAGSIDLAATAADITFDGVNAGLLGLAIAAGDVSQDGHADVILGASGNSGTVAPGVIRGDAFAYFGPFTSGTVIDTDLIAADVTITGRTNATRLGNAVGAADLNGDGVTDLVTGTRLGDSPATQPDVGSAHVLFGPIASGTSIIADASDLSIYLPEGQILSGVTGLLTGDISGDGSTDLVLGTTSGDSAANDRVQAGAALGLFGPLSPGIIDLEQSEPDYKVLGANANDQLGRGMTVANLAGDLSPDLVLTATFAAPSNGNRGKGYILEGPLRNCFVQDDFEDGLVDPAWTLVGVGNANQQSVIEENGVLKLTADGATAFFGSDNAGFLYRSITGDFRMETTIDGNPMTTGGIYRKAGLMARASLDKDDIRLIAQLAPFWLNQNQARLQFVAREFYGQPGNIAVATDVIGVPRVVRLAIERVGQELGVEYSLDDGATWIRPTTGQGGSYTIANLPPTLLVGLDMVSNNISVTSTAHFDDFLICTP